MSEIEVKCVDLCKTYEMGEKKVEALCQVNLEIERGAFVALTGTSGCGKSTLMHLLGGLDSPTSGEVWVGQKKLTGLKEKELTKLRRDYIGFVFQKFCLVQELNVRENIVLPLLLAGRKVEEAYFEELCGTLGLTKRLEHMPSELSGGQQQRVAIARALINRPSVILCDEPTGNLDARTSAEVMELLQRVHEEFHKTLVVVTHDEKVAEKAKYTLRMEDGKILKNREGNNAIV